MELIRGLHNLKSRHQGCVATIGNFDGFHRGHQQVIAELQVIAQDLNLPATLITFEPHPLEFFKPEKAPARLLRFREKVELVAATGVQRMLVIEFNDHFANYSAHEFIEQFLIQKLGIQHLLVGDDFRFGYQRQGDYALLQKIAQQTPNFSVDTMQTLRYQTQRISSSWVRHALATGDFITTKALLGRSYTMSGRVRHGEKIGRQLGYPTLNIGLYRMHSPLQGIFVVKVHGLTDSPLPAVASLGYRPTVGGKHLLLEVHILDFAAEVYGQHVTVEFCHKIRDEAKFESLPQLQQHIAADVEQARAFFVA